MRPNRTKAEFAAIRETVGMTQAMLADHLGVEVRSVKRWESPSAGGYHAPQDAWDVLDAAADLQAQVVEFALGKITEAENETGHAPDSVNLRYWRSQADYDENHIYDDGGDWRMANANSRLVAAILRLRGINVEWA